MLHVSHGFTSRLAHLRKIDTLSDSKFSEFSHNFFILDTTIRTARSFSSLFPLLSRFVFAMAHHIRLLPEWLDNSSIELSESLLQLLEAHMDLLLLLDHLSVRMSNEPTKLVMNYFYYYSVFRATSI